MLLTSLRAVSCSGFNWVVLLLHMNFVSLWTRKLYFCCIFLLYRWMSNSRTGEIEGMVESHIYCMTLFSINVELLFTTIKVWYIFYCGPSFGGCHCFNYNLFSGIWVGVYRVAICYKFVKRCISDKVVDFKIFNWRVVFMSQWRVLVDMHKENLIFDMWMECMERNRKPFSPFNVLELRKSWVWFKVVWLEFDWWPSFLIS